MFLTFLTLNIFWIADVFMTQLLFECFFLNTKFMCFQSNFECFSYFRWVKQWHHLPITIEHSLILCSTFTLQQKKTINHFKILEQKNDFFLKIFRLNLKFNLVHMFQCTVIHLNDVCNCFLFFITANSLDQLARCRLKNEKISEKNKRIKLKRMH